MDNIGVRITADPSGVAPGVQATKTELGGLESAIATLNATFQTLGAKIREAFTGGTGAAAQMTSAIKTTETATVSETAALGAMIAKVHEGAESVRTFQMRAKEFAEVYVAMFAVGQISEFINKMGEAAEKVTHLSQQFGMSAGEVQRLQGIATATGIPVDALTRGMGLLDRNMATAASGSKRMQQAMDAVGISLSDGTTQMQKLETVADKFKNMDDGPKKVALAMQLFGRSGKELIPVLDMGSEGIRQLNEKMSEYGVVSDSAVEKGTALAESTNETRLGMMGVWNVLTDALAPAFKSLVDGINEMIVAFIQSYNSGGTVAVVFGVISGVIESLVAVVSALGQIFAAIWSVIVQVAVDIWRNVEQAFGIQIPKNVNVAKLAMTEFKNLIEIVKDGIILFVDSAGAAFEALGKVIITFDKIAYDALHLNWSSIQSDWNAGMQGVANIVHAAAGKIEADAKAMGDAIAAAIAGKAAPGTEGGGGLKMPKAGGDFDFVPSAKGAKDKKEKGDLVQKLEEELQARKNAWDEMQVAQDTAQEFSLQSQADFWKAALARTDLSAKDRVKIEEKYLSAEMDVQKEAFDARLTLDKEAVTRAGQNAALKEAALRTEAADISARYGAESKEAEAAGRAVVQAEQETAKQLREVRQQEADDYKASQLDIIATAEESAKFEVQMGRTTQGQLIQLQRQYESQRYAIDLAALQSRLQLMQKDPSMSPVELAKIHAQIEQLERQHQARLTQIDQQAELERTKIMRAAIAQVSQGWAQNISQMLTLQQSFSATVKGMWTSLQQAIGTALETIIEHWLVQLLTSLIIGKGAQTAAAGGEIGANAAVAASGAYAATAAIPIIGPELAPAAAATAYAGAISWLGALTALSAEKGDWNVSEGLYHLHEKEMALPAWAAEGLRNMLGDGGTGGRSMPQDAPVHLHLHGKLISGPRDIQRWMESNRGAVAAAGKKYVKMGGK